MFAVYMYWCTLSPMGCNRCGEAASGKETIGLFDVNISKKFICVGWDGKIIVCSSSVTSIIRITSEYRTITHSDSHFNPKANLVNVLRIHGKLYYAGFELTTMTTHLCIAKYTKRNKCLGSHFLDRLTEFAKRPEYSNRTERVARTVPAY